MKFHVIYRLCDKPEAVNRLPRPFGLTKKQVIGCCLPSVINSVSALGPACSMTIVGDDLTDETKEFIVEAATDKAVCKDVTKEVNDTGKIPKLQEADAKLMQIRTMFFHPPLKNVGSLQKTFEIADTLDTGDPDTWIYFCEDDYLHDANTFMPRFLDFVAFAKNRKFALPVVYHPTDYPDQYTRLLSRNYLFQALTGYFREVSSTTMTFLCEQKTYRIFSNWIKECLIDDGKFSTIFRQKALCFSPLPGTATHMHEGVMSRFVDWQQVIQRQFKP